MSLPACAEDPGSGPRVRVLAGQPTAEEAAAALLAVDRLDAESAAAGIPGWARAARLEGRGEQQLACPADLRVQER